MIYHQISAAFKPNLAPKTLCVIGIDAIHIKKRRCACMEPDILRKSRCVYGGFCAKSVEYHRIVCDDLGISVRHIAHCGTFQRPTAVNQRRSSCYPAPGLDISPFVNQLRIFLRKLAFAGALRGSAQYHTHAVLCHELRCDLAQTGAFAVRFDLARNAYVLHGGQQHDQPSGQRYVA